MPDHDPLTPAALDPTNPLAAPSALPFGLPDFERITLAHVAEAVRAGVVAERAEVERIAAETAPATVENVLEALDRTGALLQRAVVVLETLLDACATSEVEELEEQLNPVLSAHHDAVAMHAGVHARLRELDDRARRGEVELDEPSRRLLDESLRDVARAGAHLPADEQEQLRALNARILDLESSFGRLVLAADNAGAVLVTDFAQLEGLSDDEIAAAAGAAAEAGHDEAWLIELTLPTQQGVLARLRDRDVRARVHAASVTRGTHAGADTRGVLVELVRLRARRAALLGYRDHATYVVEEETARTTAAVSAVLDPLAARVAANVARDAADRQRVLDAERAARGLQPVALAPWDWAWCSERLRQERYELDDAALRPYLELDRVLTHGVFEAARRLYGVTLTERPDLRGYHPEVRVWEVHDADGTALGLFLGDYLTRPSKRGGAWMSSLVDQSHLLGERAVVVNNLNVARPAAGEPVLLTWDDVITAFHEFGHALHALLSDVRYPSQSGTSVPSDFVEYPSQVNEQWAWEPTLLGGYAVHHATGEPLPAAWIDRLRSSAEHDQGHATAELLAATVLDQAWHRLTDAQADAALAGEPADVVDRFEDAALRAAGLDLPLVPPRYRSTYFNHVFGGGYAATYYSYLWSEVLDADTVVWFEEHGGLTRANGDRFRREVLAVGGSTDPVAAFERLRGRPASTAPLLRRRGLADVEVPGAR